MSHDIVPVCRRRISKYLCTVCSDGSIDCARSPFFSSCLRVARSVWRCTGDAFYIAFPIAYIAGVGAVTAPEPKQEVGSPTFTSPPMT